MGRREPDELTGETLKVLEETMQAWRLPGPLDAPGGVSLKGAFERVVDTLSARPSEVLLGLHFGFYLLGTKFDELLSGQLTLEDDDVAPRRGRLLAAGMAAGLWTLAVRRVLSRRVAAVSLTTKLARLVLPERLSSPKREQMAWHEARYTPYPYLHVLEAGKRHVDRHPSHFRKTADSFRSILRWEPVPWLQGLLEATSLADPLLKYAPDSANDSYLADWWSALRHAVEHLIERQYLDLFARCVRWLSPAFVPETRSVLTAEDEGPGLDEISVR